MTPSVLYELKLCIGNHCMHYMHRKREGPNSLANYIVYDQDACCVLMDYKIQLTCTIISYYSINRYYDVQRVRPHHIY